MNIENLVWDKYEKISIIGEGAYGIVYKSRNKINNEIVAIKKFKINQNNIDEGIPQNCLREISILQELNHPNIVRLIEKFIFVGKIFLVFEYIEYDLQNYIQKNNINEEEFKKISLQLINGVHYLHINRIIHRDLKPQNILIDSFGKVKIADFGLARNYFLPVKSITNKVVTLWYRSPELLLGLKKYTSAIDIWSLGCIMTEMLLKKPLFKDNCEIGQIFKIFEILGSPKQDIELLQHLPYFSYK